LIAETKPLDKSTPEQRRRRSKKAEIVRPPQGFQLPNPIRRLQRQAPLLALQAAGELSTRLKQLTGRDVIDLNRIIEAAQFLYQQRELARRGPNPVSSSLRRPTAAWFRKFRLPSATWQCQAAPYSRFTIRQRCALPLRFPKRTLQGSPRASRRRSSSPDCRRIANGLRQPM